MGKPATQAEIERALRAATRAQYPVGAVEISKDGSIRLVMKDDGATAAKPQTPLKTW